MSETYRVLVTGCREFDDYTTVCLELGGVLRHLMATADPVPQIVVVHGAARGADTLADRAARGVALRQRPHCVVAATGVAVEQHHPAAVLARWLGVRSLAELLAVWLPAGVGADNDGTAADCGRRQGETQGRQWETQRRVGSSGSQPPAALFG